MIKVNDHLIADDNKENGCLYPNSNSRHLKSISISGLIISDKPELCVCDSAGQIHSICNSNWNFERGEGIFEFNAFIYGDFTLTCNLEYVRSESKERWVFKYKNNTEQLPHGEVIELKENKIEMNPLIPDSIDGTLFTIYMALKNVSSNENRIAHQRPHCINSIPTTPPIKPFRKRRSNSNSKFNMLSNDKSSQLVTASSATATGPHHSKTSPIQEAISSAYQQEHEICQICKIDDPIYIDQLMRCSECANHCHCLCAVGRRIPFSLKSQADRQNREKFIARNYGNWKCPSCTRSPLPKLRPIDKLANRRTSINDEAESNPKALHNFNQQWKRRVTVEGDVSFQRFSETTEEEFTNGNGVESQENSTATTDPVDSSTSAEKREKGLPGVKSLHSCELDGDHQSQSRVTNLSTPLQSCSLNRGVDNTEDSSAKALDTLFASSCPIPQLTAARDPEKMVEVSKHVIYEKYFNKLKIGGVKEQIKQNMINDGVDPSYIDKSPTELIPTFQTPYKPNSSSVQKAQETFRYTKTPLQPVDPKQMDEGCVWICVGLNRYESINLDENLFSGLFVQDLTQIAPKPTVKKTALTAEMTTAKSVGIVKGKRAQNGGVALFWRKTFIDLADRIKNMDDCFSIEKLTSLLDYFPTDEEQRLLAAYKSDTHRNSDIRVLNEVEKYMLLVVEIPVAKGRLDCMMFKKRFDERFKECATSLTRLEKACNDVFSKKLSKFLHYVLIVGNKLRRDESAVGFSLDSLSALSTTKGFDKETSVLKYLVCVIQQNDAECLSFPEELASVGEACTIGLHAVAAECRELKHGVQQGISTMMRIKEHQENGSIDMSKFLFEASAKVDDIGAKAERVSASFKEVQKYFAESPSKTSQSVFSTLNAFMRELKSVRDEVEKEREKDKALSKTSSQRRV